MKMTIRFTYADEDPQREHLALVVFADTVAYEKEFGRSSYGALEELPATTMTWLAWQSLHRTNRVSTSYEEWLPRVDDFEPIVASESDSPKDAEETVGEAAAG